MRFLLGLRGGVLNDKSNLFSPSRFDFVKRVKKEEMVILMIPMIPTKMVTHIKNRKNVYKKCQ